MMKWKFLLVSLVVITCLGESSLFGQSQRKNVEDRIFQDIALGSLSDVMSDLLAGSNLNVRNGRGETPLMAAIINNQSRISRYLLARGARLDVRNIDGNTPLFVAIMVGDLALIRMMQNQVVHYSTFNDNGEGILEVAIQSQRYDILKYLLDQKLVDIDRPNPLGFTPLGFAALLQDSQAVQILLQYKADEDGRVGDVGRTPLMVSSMLGDIPTMNFLLSERADTDLLDRYGRTALSIAIDASQNEAAKLLISKRSDYKTIDMFGQTPMSLAIANGLDDVAMALINRGVNIDKGNPICEETPVMQAAAFGRLRLLRHMVEQEKGDLRKVLSNDCMEITSQDPYRASQYRKGWNALDIAEEAMQIDVVNYLIFSQKMKFNKSLSAAALQKLAS